MNKDLLFLTGCIGCRLLFAFFAKNVSNDNLPLLAMIALIPAITFLHLYITDGRPKGFFSTSWWNDVRPVHGFMYALFAVYAFKRERFAWKVLVLDALFGLLVWFRHK